MKIFPEIETDKQIKILSNKYIDINTKIVDLEITTYIVEETTYDREITNIQIKRIGNVIFFNKTPPSFISYIGGELRFEKPETILERENLIIEYIYGKNNKLFINKS